MSTEYELRSQNVSKCLLNMNYDHKMLTNVYWIWTAITKC